MSRIWDSIKQVERSQIIPVSHPQSDARRFEERRCGERVLVRIPLFVYGHMIEGGPFYEATEAVYVNARGGLITLPHLLRSGQKLLLTNKLNERDQQCRVVGLRSAYLNGLAIAVGFAGSVPDFWSRRQ